MNQSTQAAVNREYKDRLFKSIFREKQDLLDLYNALNGTDYDNPADIVVNTLEEYSLFVEKIREYQRRKCSIEEAIDKAVDDCVQAGILEEVLRDNREEVRSMLLTEYNEQAHIENERKIAVEEAFAEGVEVGIGQGIGNMI